MWFLLFACAPDVRLLVPDPMYTADGIVLSGNRRWREGQVAQAGAWQVTLGEVTPMMVLVDVHAGQELRESELSWTMKVEGPSSGQVLDVACTEQAAARINRVGDSMALPTDERHRLYCRLGGDAELVLFGATRADGRGYVRTGRRRLMIEPLRQMVEDNLVDGFLLRESGRPIAAVEGDLALWLPADGDAGVVAGLAALAVAAGLEEERGG